MAVWEPRQQARSWWRITQVSWTDWTALDTYYWLEHSFQYSANINCDDEMHGIKLANKATFSNHYKECQLVSCWINWVMALNVKWLATPIMFNHENFTSGWSSTWDQSEPATDWDVCPWVVFQDFMRYGVNVEIGWQPYHWVFAKNIASGIDYKTVPLDHPEATDESISDPSNAWLPMQWNITAMLNYNNTRLVVGAGQELWVYYPELDAANPNNPNYDRENPIPIQNRKMGWKKVLDYENWVTIVGLTCTFEYLKVRAVDEWWNTKVYYYQGNNNLRDTFVYNVVDLTGERVLHVYSLNGIDYYTTSIDWTDGYVNLNKMIGNVPVQLFHQRAWLDPLDINFKAPYFVWPTGINAAYKSGRFYIADAYGVFQFIQTPASYDKGYMKWKLSDDLSTTTGQQVYWVCENQGFLYVSTEDGCREMRLYDTWVDGYQDQWVLISREFEWKEWWTVTKMLDEIRMNFELNPLTDENWSIDVYVSPNNLWRNTFEFTVANGWHHAMHIDQTNAGTRAEKSNLFNDLNNGNSSFKFDWQTITYAIVITKWDEDHATPIVRQLDIKYHCKDKVNNVYDIN